MTTMRDTTCQYETCDAACPAKAQYFIVLTAGLLTLCGHHTNAGRAKFTPANGVTILPIDHLAAQPALIAARATQ